MSALSQLFRDKAEEIRIASSVTESAVEFMKQAGIPEEDARILIQTQEIEKQATEALISSGVDVEEAAKLVKAANFNLKDITNYQPIVEDEHPSVELLKQAAAYIEALEADLDAKATALSVAETTLEEERGNSIEKIAELTLPNMEDLPEALQRASASGSLSFDDLKQLKGIEPELLNKLASSFESPVGLGAGYGVDSRTLDPLAAWLTQ